jgi:hypothetical protein
MAAGGSPHSGRAGLGAWQIWDDLLKLDVPAWSSRPEVWRQLIDIVRGPSRPTVIRAELCQASLLRGQPFAVMMPDTSISRLRSQRRPRPIGSYRIAYASSVLEGLIPAAGQLASVGKHPCSSTKVRKATIPSSSRASDSSVSATASPSNTLGGFVSVGT